MSRGTRWWTALAALLCVLALAAQALPHEALDWQPSLATHAPWRAFSAAAVHYSGMHLASNLAGAALVAAYGAAARLPPHSSAAWCAAWPLTQALLTLRPELAHFGGLSGVLHAGVAVASVHLLLRDTGARRWVGAAVLAGLAIKVVGEEPWGAVLRHPAGWDIAVAPLAHATGLLSGVFCAAVADVLTSTKHRSHA